MKERERERERERSKQKNKWCKERKSDLTFLIYLFFCLNFCCSRPPKEFFLLNDFILQKEIIVHWIPPNLNMFKCMLVINKTQSCFHPQLISQLKSPFNKFHWSWLIAASLKTFACFFRVKHACLLLLLLLLVIADMARAQAVIFCCYSF